MIISMTEDKVTVTTYNSDVRVTPTFEGRASR